MSFKENPYYVIRSEVLGVVSETPTIKTIVLKPTESFGFQTGQFIQFTIYGEGEAPFTPSSSPFETEEIEVTIMKVGRVTARIHNLQPGDIVGIRGPLGRGYPTDEMDGKEILIVGGGVGLAPLRSLLLHLLHNPEKYKRIVLMYGARTPADIVYKDQFEMWAKKGVEIYRTVDHADEDWNESVGVVTTLFDKTQLDTKNGFAVVCGPPIMMKFATLKLLEIGYSPDRILLSMEKNMSCGIGKCGHCAMGKYFVCKDGPVFKYSEIQDIEGIWE